MFESSISILQSCLWEKKSKVYHQESVILLLRSRKFLYIKNIMLSSQVCHTNKHLQELSRAKTYTAFKSRKQQSPILWKQPSLKNTESQLAFKLIMWTRGINQCLHAKLKKIQVYSVPNTQISYYLLQSNFRYSENFDKCISYVAVS